MKRFALATSVIALLLAASHAQAQSLTYTINQTISGGSVTGQIVTDGSTGVLSQSNITSWNLTLTGAGGVTKTLTNSGSAFVVSGGDLSATPQNLTFNFSGTDGGYMLVQTNLYSGTQYYCNNTSWYGCKPGASVVPGVYSDPSAQYMTFSGLQIIGTAGPGYSDQDLKDSLSHLADSRTAQWLVNNLSNQWLLGGNEQVNCSNCGGTALNIGSLAASTHGRVSLTPNLTLFGGMTMGQYRQKEANVRLNAGFAAAVQYDPADHGTSRPYLEGGLTGAVQNVTYDRAYQLGQQLGLGSGRTHVYQASVFARAGWVDRVTPRDEAAVSVGWTRSYQIVEGYSEAPAGNPVPAVMPDSVSRADIVTVGGQYTHLVDRHLELGVNADVDRVSHIKGGVQAVIAGTPVTAKPGNFTYAEVGVRAGLRLRRGLTVDIYASRIVAPRAIGSSTHGGVGVRWNF